MCKSFFLLVFCFSIFAGLSQKMEFGKTFPNEKWMNYEAVGAFGEHQLYLTHGGYPEQISVLKFDEDLTLVNKLDLPEKTKKNSFKFKEHLLVNDQLYVFYDDYDSKAEEVRLYVDQVDLTSMKQTKDNQIITSLSKEIHYLPLIEFHQFTWTSNIRIAPLKNGEEFMLIHDHHPSKDQAKLHLKTLDKDFNELNKQSFDLPRSDMFVIASFMEDNDQPILVYAATENLADSKDDEKRFEYSFVYLNSGQLDIKSPAKKDVHFIKTLVSQDSDGNIDLTGVYGEAKYKYAKGLCNVKFNIQTKEIVYETSNSISGEIKEFESESLRLRFNRKLNLSDGSFVLLFEDVNKKSVNNSTDPEYYFGNVYIFCFDKKGSLTNGFRIDKSQKLGISDEYTDEAKFYGSFYSSLKNSLAHIYFLDAESNYKSGSYDSRLPWRKGGKTVLVHCIYDLSKVELVQRKVVLDNTQLSDFLPVIAQPIELDDSDQTQFLFLSRKEIKLGSVIH